jgi:hypothetical protein
MESFAAKGKATKGALGARESRYTAGGGGRLPHAAKKNKRESAHGQGSPVGKAPPSISIVFV